MKLIGLTRSGRIFRACLVRLDGKRLLLTVGVCIIVVMMPPLAAARALWNASLQHVKPAHQQIMHQVSVTCSLTSPHRCFQRASSGASLTLDLECDRWHEGDNIGSYPILVERGKHEVKEWKRNLATAMCTGSRPVHPGRDPGVGIVPRLGCIC